MGVAYSTSIKFIGPIAELKNIDLIDFQYADNGVVSRFLGNDYESYYEKQVDRNHRVQGNLTSEFNHWKLEFYGDVFCCLSIDIDSYTVKPPVDKWFEQFNTEKWCLRLSVGTDNPSLYISEIYFGHTKLKYETDFHPYDSVDASYLNPDGFKERFIKELTRNLSI
jgi:hypothetical protein